MPDPQQDTAWIDEDPFLDESYDWRSLPADRQAQFKKHFRIQEPQRDTFDIPDPDIQHKDFKTTLAKMLDDPGVRREMAEKDPRFGARYEADCIEDAVHHFRKANPDYRKTSKNERMLMKYLSDKYLDGRIYTSDRAAMELYRLGRWTAASLQEAYSAGLAAGSLDVPEGRARELSTVERREVIAVLQALGPISAVERFVEIAMSGLPQFSDARQVMRWRANHPEVANDSALFVFRHYHPEIQATEITAMLPELQATHPLWTVALIEQFYGHWQTRYLMATLPKANADDEPVDLESLSDVEVEKLWALARVEALKHR